MSSGVEEKLYKVLLSSRYREEIYELGKGCLSSGVQGVDFGIQNQG